MAALDQPGLFNFDEWLSRATAAPAARPAPTRSIPMNSNPIGVTMHADAASHVGHAHDGERLIYYRCLCCLEPFTVPESQERQHAHPCHDMNTPADTERMGPATVDRKHYTTEVSVCDARCTSAVGPLCVCKCKCANHGSGRTLEKYHELPKSRRDEHTRLAHLWHHDIADAVAAGNEEYRRLGTRGWTNLAEYRFREGLRKSIHETRRARTLKKRQSSYDTLAAAIETARTTYANPAAS